MLSEDQLLEVIKLKEDKRSSRYIGEQLGVDKATVNYFLSRKTRSKFWAKYDEGDFEVKIQDMSLSLDHCIETSTEFDVVNLAKRLRTAQKTNNQLRKIHRGTIDNSEVIDTIMDGVKLATSRIADTEVTYVDVLTKPGTNARKATLEILFSDLQIGKVSRHYNTKVAKAACQDYGTKIIKAINDRSSMYDVEALVFAMIGDVVEDHMKHGVPSAVSTDTGLAEQMSDAIEAVWTGILEPLCLLNLPIQVICVTGNHGSSMHKGMDSFKAGRFSYDFVIHKTLESYCRLKGYTHVKFNIPDGTFTYNPIYGKYAIYEHGYHNAFSEKGMTDQMLKRGQQVGKHVSYWRQGDKHHHTSFGQGQQVLNGAFFGIDEEGIEYSGILGFNSIPSQTIMFHVDEDTKGKNNIKDIVNIQLSQC